MKSVEKKHRRFLAAMLALCLLLGLCPLTPSAQAEETTEPATQSAVTNTTKETAAEVNFNEEVRFELSASVREQWFKVATTKPGQSIIISASGDSYIDIDAYDSNGNYVRTWCVEKSDEIVVYAQKVGTYFIRFSLRENGIINTTGNLSFSLSLLENDEYEPNDTMAEAAELPVNEERAIITIGGDEDWFKFTTTKPNQFVQLQCSKNLVYATCYDESGKSIGGWRQGGEYIATGAVGNYYLCFQDYTLATASGLVLYTEPVYVSVSLLDNDTNEPNDTKETATPLRGGESAEFTLAGRDVDYFKVTTTAPGQDIALTVSGYDYTNRGERFSLCFDPAGDLQYSNTSCAAYAEIDANRTLYLHAAAAGEHYIALKRSDATPLTRMLSVEILDGDKNEPNDTKEKATSLTLGTDETFMVGGFGDEDWFSFEVDPGVEGEKNLYTLNFSGLNTDYSDSFYYDIYAPDGKAVVKQTLVNIQHSYVFNCDLQGGVYHVRVYTRAGVNGYNNKDYFGADWNGNGRVSTGYPRSELRICVNKGGDDPYENNNTWQTAAYVPVGNIQHVLSSTADADWFCFNVLESDMTLHLTSAARTNVRLYREDVLMKDGIEKAKSEFTDSRGYDDAKLFGDLYFKLTDAGIYYIKLTADSSYASPEIRTTGIELLPATDEENNDTWKKATPLYEGVPRSFTLSADNDADWFKIVVPEDGARISINATDSRNYSSYSFYSGRDFQTAGDNAGPIKEWKDCYHTIDVLGAGTYYLRVMSGHYKSTEPRTIRYSILPNKNENDSLKNAETLNPGEWAEFYAGNDNSYGCYYFYIDKHTAGEVVRVSREEHGSYRYFLLNGAGRTIGSTSLANCSFVIPEDGEYYISAETRLQLDSNGKPLLDRLRYDIGNSKETVTSIKSVDSLTLLEGETMFLDLRCAPYEAKSNDGSTFYVNTPSCVYYDSDSGYLTAESAGTGTLTVSLNGDSSVKKKIPVTVLAKDSLKVEKLSIERAPETLSLGTSADLTAEYTLAGGAVLTNPEKAVTWTSSDPKVLYVSPGGKVTAVGGGTATVTATVGSVSEESAPITVTAAPETPQETVSSIKLNKYSLTLYVGEAGEQLTASILPEGSTARVTWASSNTNAAAVSPDGVVTPIAPGVSSITAEAGGRRVSATVTVFAERVRVTGVSFGETKHEIPMGGTATLTATITPADATVKTLIWTSSDEGVATVSRTGIVTALSVGETTIRATSVDGNFYAEITVTVTAKAQLGDVNGDGYIDSADAMLCLRSAVGLKKLTEEQKSAADVNKDGFVDAGDAIKILRYDAKLIDSLN